MCFNATISILSGLFCWCTAFYLLQSGKTYDAIGLAIFSSMQFVDAILHAFPQKTNVNWTATSFLIPLILCSQLGFNMWANGDNHFLYFLPVFAAYMFWRFHGYSEPSCNRWGSPVWGGKEILVFEFLLFSSLVLYPRWKILLFNWCYMAIVAHFLKGGYGSMWCSLSCLAAVYLLLGLNTREKQTS
jgi:hypothetical protein